LTSGAAFGYKESESVGGLELAVPWLNLGIIFGAVYAAALLTTWMPAVRASRIFPAEVLRYE
jgi:ABC-type lipoprotein release transport system permease subunit